MILQKLYLYGGGAFYYSEDMESVVLPSNLKTLGDNCFIMCGKLRQVHIPSTVSSFGPYEMPFSSSEDKDYYLDSRYCAERFYENDGIANSGGKQSILIRTDLRNSLPSSAAYESNNNVSFHFVRIEGDYARYELNN